MSKKRKVYEGKWSPFDPQWYKAAFDKFISTADQLFNTDLIIEQGFEIPDADRSRSSIFRNEAVLNNSFNEKDLRETLKDIYLNSTHKLIASNHDNTKFFQWTGHMSDMDRESSDTYICTFSIPTENFISAKERDKFKLSQYYRKWIKIEDILNNWEIFKFHCLLFIDQRINSEYELRIDDHECMIKFRYFDHWVKNNVPIYIYKFDTKASYRALISKELVCNQWNWKIPINYFNDTRVANSTKIIVAFNRINDQSIRKDGNEKVDVLGDNIEFLEVKDGYIDISEISAFNKILIESELTEYLWMSIFVPRFFHEFPILLPTDNIYRPYEGNFQSVVTLDYNRMQHVYANKENESDQSKVYVDLNEDKDKTGTGWIQLIRPVVLSDAFDNPFANPYESFEEEINNLRDLTVKGADIIEEFRFFIKEYTTDSEYYKLIDDLKNILYSIHETYNHFLDSRKMDQDDLYEIIYQNALIIIDEVKKDGPYSEWFNPPQFDEKGNKDFWFQLSPLIYIPREIADKFAFIKIIDEMKDHGVLMEDYNSFMGKNRFQRPIEEHDFWTFEYDPDTKTWRPYPLTMTHHFPDVYIPVDETEASPTPNRIFKAFFFYSDTMNILNESSDIIRPTASWDEDVQEYRFDQEAVYRDIFMEKFYWMGIRSIYKGLLSTKSRWEVLEYIINNSSYDRFNQLFLNTMDPYFKLGLATYLKSENYEFPFDDAIAKLEESIDNKFIGYKRITNFEMYLNKTWIPSYFDYVTKIMDDWDWSKRLLRRPRNSFNIDRFLPFLIQLEEDISSSVDKLNKDIDNILENIYQENYNIDVSYLETMKDISSNMKNNLSILIKFTKNLDLEIYSIDDVNKIIMYLNNHIDIFNDVKTLFNTIYENTKLNDVHEEKRRLFDILSSNVSKLPSLINEISEMIQLFNMENFMKGINDLRSYFDYAKTNPDDKSLIGHINKFDDPWSKDVKEKRNLLFQSTSILYGSFDSAKSYSPEEVSEFVTNVTNVKNDIYSLKDSINKFWKQFSYSYDQTVLDRLDYGITMIDELVSSMNKYLELRTKLTDQMYLIRVMLQEMDKTFVSQTEDSYRKSIDNSLDDILVALSYIAGINNKENANKAYSSIIDKLLSWDLFIGKEKEVFDMLYRLTEPPIDILEVMNNHTEMLSEIMKFLDTVNIEYKPDSSWPTYSDVYRCTDLSIITGGFNHQIGDEVYIPNLGSYKIDSIEGNVCKCSSISELDFVNTVFKNPLDQNNIFDSITNGLGLGITVKPESVSHQVIINDEVFDSIKTRIQNNLYLLNKHLESANPYDNTDANRTSENIKTLINDWNDIIKIYSNYMSEDIKTYGNELISTYETIYPKFIDFIESRSKIDISKVLDDIDSCISNLYKFIESINMLNENFMYYYGLFETNYNSFIEFYDTGSNWVSGREMSNYLSGMKMLLNSLITNVIVPLDDSGEKDKIKENIKTVIEFVVNQRNIIDQLPNFIIDINPTIRNTQSKLNQCPEYQKDIWYRIKKVRVGDGGKNYKVGDIVKLVSDDPSDSRENSDSILCEITRVEDGIAIEVKMIMDYALTYQIFGSRKTESKVGTGSGLILDIMSTQISIDDCTLFNSDDSDISNIKQFDENDMFVFKFENIHDLNIGYEVFYGGKQITNFFQRHISDDDPLHPKNIDALYLKANDVMELQNSSIFIPAEHYFIYQLDNVEIIDPGAGYSVGQDIFVDTGVAALRLKVSQLIHSPMKSIKEVELGNGDAVYKNIDPSSDEAHVVKDSLNNIDDEFNVGYYDLIPKSGIRKPAVKSLTVDEMEFLSRRFDNMNQDDRNKIFMYPDVNMPLIEDAPYNGDPEYHFYLGSQINNSQHPMEDTRKWNCIMNVIPPTHPFIPDNRRFPYGKPPKGEYQEIDSGLLHNPYEGKMREITPEEVQAEWESDNSGTIEKDVKELSGDIVSEVWEENGLPDITPHEYEMLKPDVIYTWNTNGYGPFPEYVDKSDLLTTLFMETFTNGKETFEGDLVVDTYNDIPRHIKEWPEGKIGMSVVVKQDERNGNHRMMYRIRTFIISGYFVYDLPIKVDTKWNKFDIDWMNIDFYPDMPSISAQYPDAPWMTAVSFLAVQREIIDGKYENKHPISKINDTSFIADLTVDDLSVFNWTTHEWEDLHDENRWKLDVRYDEKKQDYGFTLTFLKSGIYKYDMRLYLNKIPETQMRNAKLKRDAILKVKAIITAEVNKPAVNTSVYTGRHLRIRKLFPYEQKETFTLGFSEDKEPLGYEMNFKLSNYIHFKNQIHLEDIKIYNKTANRFENILDSKMFEVRFKDDRAFTKGHEKQSFIYQTYIGNPGLGFIDGEVWAYNAEYNVHIFGYCEADFKSDGHITSFTPIHCINIPDYDVSLEFEVYQRDSQSKYQRAIIMADFRTEDVNVMDDGYIHNVKNRMAPLPKEIKIIVQYDLIGPTEYDVIISKSQHTWSFIKDKWLMSPTFHIPDYNIQSDRLYILTDNGRFPLVNPATGKPTIHAEEFDNGTDVTFYNLYRKYEKLQICSLPYPVRSVYTQRHIPSHGYIDLSGKINKPLNKKYFEFWVNGKLLFDEVTIITPTKIFLHGLKSLKNLEIIEVNRDPNEYFSDRFIEVEQSNLGRPYKKWNYNTYLDDALTGNLEGDNYTAEEQQYLLSPVWPQVDKNHPEYKNYPPNTDEEDDILTRAYPEDNPSSLDGPTYQFMVIDPPTLEGKAIVERSLTFEHFGLIPIDDNTISEMLNEEWSEEIKNDPYFPEHTVISDDEWYGLVTRLYDEYGIRVHTLNEAAYHITDNNYIRINATSKMSTIVRNPKKYDLS